MGESVSTFHVVCRDCRTEAVERSELAAEHAADRHRKAADHQVEFAPFEQVESPQWVND